MSQENIDKVNAIIAQYGFKRNIFASNLAAKKKFKFAVFLPKFKEIEYWKSQIVGVKKAEEEFKKFGIQLEYFYYDFDPISFKNTISKVIDFECNGLLFAPIFHKESIAFLDLYAKKQLPVVMIDSDIQNEMPHFYIGQDAFKSGYLAGRLISFAVKDQRKVLIIKITRDIESTSVYLQRIKGFYSYFEENPSITNFEFSELNVKESDINNLHVDMFADTSSIFIPNSRAYIIARFLEQHHIKGIRIIGYDLLEDNIKYLNSGSIDFLINQKPEEQGYLAVQYLYKKVVLQEDFTSNIIIPLEIIVKENYIRPDNK